VLGSQFGDQRLIETLGDEREDGGEHRREGGQDLVEGGERRQLVGFVGRVRAAQKRRRERRTYQLVRSSMNPSVGGMTL
jgi:hypothetical protein